MQNSSPSKYKSTNKNKQQIIKRQMPQLKQYIRQFPLDIPQDVTDMIKNFQPIQQNFQTNVSNLKLYKVHLGNAIESDWIDFMDFLKKIIIKMHKKSFKYLEERQKKIVQLLNINSKYESQKQSLKDKIQKIEHLRQLQNVQLNMTNQQLQLVSRQMTDIYKTLQSDMNKVLGYLASLDEQRAKKDQQGSNQLYSSLDNLSTLLNNMERQQKDTTSTLGSMRQLIKAMAKSTKVTTGTQVDESQLQTKANNIFTSNDEELNYQEFEAANINLPTLNKQEHLLDKLKVKQKQTQHQIYKPKQHIQKPWALTPTLLVFLQNMSKENQAGRVLPYVYVKQMIADIYAERMLMQQEIIQGQVGNAMLFDQFVVHFFLRKHRIRRLAEVKLLEFIISIKYYSKFWLKVQTFCCLMDVMKYQPTFEPSDSNNYKFDLYCQNFFFTVYRVLSTYDTITQEDGTVYVPLSKIKKLMKALLFFTDEMSRSRLIVKLEKQIRVFQKVDHVQFDYGLILFIDQYFNTRRRCNNIINRNFSKLHDKVEGYLSLDQMLGIFQDMDYIYKAGAEFPYKYPIDSTLQISKLYLYSITSSKNNYQMNGPSFLQACQRYGFNAPFPFIHSCYKKKKQGTIKINSLEQKVTDIANNKVDQNQKTVKKPQINQIKQIIGFNDGKQVQNINLNTQRIDIASKIFSQHYSLLKQLKDYVDIFKQTLSTQTNPQNLWKSFNQISRVLQKGCQFLKYPLLVKK